jgi:hypothetical protein
MNRSLLAAALVAASLSLALSPSAAAALPRSCNEVMLSGAVTDGEYLIEPSVGVRFSVYCAGLTWGVTEPKDYLTLAKTGYDPATGVGFNYSQLTAGGYWPGETVRTVFTKVRIDPATLTVDIGDLTFATSTGTVTTNHGGTVSAVPFAVAADCLTDGNVANAVGQGVANIDLTGTPFDVRSVFATEGYYPAGTVNGVAVNVNKLPAITQQVPQARIVKLTGGGQCGATGPDGFNSSVNFWLFSQGTVSMPALKLKFRG